MTAHDLIPHMYVRSYNVSITYTYTLQYPNETPMVHGLAADNNNMQSVLMGNMETIIYDLTIMIL